MNLSKSKYTALWRCPRLVWLGKYMPEEEEVSAAVEERMAAGAALGALARGIFGEYLDVSATDGRGEPDVPAMIERTRAAIAAGVPVICEAAFSFDGLYCAVDILKREGDGYAIYEVKSSTDASKEIYAADVAYQLYVLRGAGVRVTGTHLISVRRDYVRRGEIKPEELLTVNNIDAEVSAQYAVIEDRLKTASSILTSDVEPAIDLSVSCNTPYPCSFFGHCTAHLPCPSVFDVYRLRFSDKLALYYDGVRSFEDLHGCKRIKNDKQRRQIATHLGLEGDHIDKPAITRFLSGLSYPLYFLDFETMQSVIPPYDGTHPYQQIPFQYSLHYLLVEGGELYHTDFLGEPEYDPRRPLAEALCRDIPADACVTAYNKSFECGRLTELAEAFPDLSAHLLSIRDNIVELLTPFQSGYYYTGAMGGSFSIKSVLPALYPDCPELDYHSLEGVHNGSEAMALFPTLAELSGEDRARARHNLLKYCELDTLAMVRVYEKLLAAVR